MSRRKVFTDIVECVRWMLEKPGQRSVKNVTGSSVYKGICEAGLHIPLAQVYGPWTAIHDEHGDIPEEVTLPELDAELRDAILIASASPGHPPNWKKVFQLVLSAAVRMSKEQSK